MECLFHSSLKGISPKDRERIRSLPVDLCPQMFMHWIFLFCFIGVCLIVAHGCLTYYASRFFDLYPTHVHCGCLTNDKETVV